MKKLRLFAILTFIIYSCKNFEKKIEGTWVIENVYFNNNIIELEYLVDVIIIYSNNTCKLPIYKLDDRNTDKQIGEWKLIKNKNNLILHFDSQNEFFNGGFLIDKFYRAKSPNNLGYIVQMNLKSNDYILECYKIINE